MVSTLVPLTVMVTTTATLVYIHSRYMEPDDAPTLLEHHARALANKFLPCTASMFATAVGFAALAVSDIRPVREMGLWTACGLIVAWVGCFTLFPALQSLLRTPTRDRKRRTDGKWFAGFVDALVPATRRYRWLLVGPPCAHDAVRCGALFGIPGKLAPLALETDALTYVNPGERVAQDTRYFERRTAWMCSRAVAANAARPRLGSRSSCAPWSSWRGGSRAIRGSLPSTARPRCCAGRAMSNPAPISCRTRPHAWPKLAADLEQILLTEPGARGYVDVTDLANVRLEHPRPRRVSSAASVPCADSSEEPGPRRRRRSGIAAGARQRGRATACCPRRSPSACCRR